MKRLFALIVTLLATTAPLAHADYYHDGGPGYSWLGFQSGKDYSGNYDPGTYINAPHRADWENKLQQLRQYEAYRRQQDQYNTAACGFTGAPSYCYQLIIKPRYYPADTRIVRF